jgi:hypothetical protein
MLVSDLNQKCSLPPLAGERRTHLCTTITHSLCLYGNINNTSRVLRMQYWSQIYCTVFGVTETWFGLVTGFINYLQVVTTITYNTVTHLRNLQSLHANIPILSVVVCTYSVSFKWSLQFTLYIFTSRPLVFSCTPGFSSLRRLSVRANGLQNNSSARTPRKTVALWLRFVSRAIA